MTDFRPGDTVRLVQPITLSEVEAPRPKIGDVFEVATSARYGGGVEIVRHDNGHPYKGGGWWQDHFELIARAGDTVEFLPGDTVEFICERAVLEGYGVNRRVGDRYTVIPRFNDFADPTVVFTLRDGHRTWAPARYFKLVHRPVRAKDAEPLVYTYAGVGPLHDGDELEVTFKGEFRMLGAKGFVRTQRGGYLPLDLATSVKEVEKPLAVGDRVRTCLFPSDKGTLVHIQGKYGMLEVNPDRIYSTLLTNLERVS